MKLADWINQPIYTATKVFVCCRCNTSILVGSRYYSKNSKGNIEKAHRECIDAAATAAGLLPRK